MTRLTDAHDALLLDLDGTLYRGPDPIDGAVDILRECSSQLCYVTNNASRSPAQVAEHLRDLGFRAPDESVVTSSQAAGRLLAGLLPAGASVLVVGTEALEAEVSAAGLVPVRTADPTPAAVVQGHSPETGWANIAEATYAVRAGARWVATNADTSLPTPRGLGPGNGAMVAAVAAATGATPIVAGKPEAPLMKDALERSGSTTPLVVGDRLDTDIAGANEVGVPSLLVLTGVSTVHDVLTAVPHERPTYLASSLSALLEEPAASLVPSEASDTWSVSLSGSVLRVETTGDVDADGDLWIEALRDVLPAVWALGGFDTVEGASGAAADVVARWTA
ncbi:HAD-IIA family hydrolase [Rhodococcus sp. SORGH_AS_0301]|uniref:HAD-IIA family hydrolase n=1 Tax=Rhodococcus sp. SORGH_AS_0301 TaxID=3041780 RepID=UPI002782D12C|nr:HAD-IIA family hydrolase [Rhodococcus sp. SORGH_AS_0301]MDQ1180559.1 glycerol 3-phosphatase-2 [Rhodococcus sp. SORGH_AS_0301]